MSRLLVPPRIRSTGDAGRKVTWLELFFDLIFVAAVGQVAEPLRHHYALPELVRFAPLFVLIWWAWMGHTVFSTRFDTDDLVQRALTFLQIFAVAAMAANAKDALDSRSSAGFAAAYAAVRFVLVAQYIRARHVSDARALTLRYGTGHGTAALLWLVSPLTPAPARFWVWALAFAIDLGTPCLAVRHSVKVPPDAAHLPERFGLFTLILLGESVVAVMEGMESQEGWPPDAAASAILGMGILFLIWWWYFDGAAAASEQPVRNRREAIRFHVWSYAHFPLYLGIIVAGVGVQRSVTAATRHALSPQESLIFAGAASLMMLAMSAIDAASAARTADSRRLAAHLAVAGVLAAVGAISIASPLAMVSAVFVACAAQLALSPGSRIGGSTGSPVAAHPR
jgi:low temperature requirement protein LtrA